MLPNRKKIRSVLQIQTLSKSLGQADFEQVAMCLCAYAVEGSQNVIKHLDWQDCISFGLLSRVLLLAAPREWIQSKEAKEAVCSYSRPWDTKYTQQQQL